MRVLLFLLLLANLGLLAWLAWYDGDTRLAVPAGRGDVTPERRLVLLGETEERRPDEPATETRQHLAEVQEAPPAVTDPAGEAADSTDVPAEKCATVGPFERLEVAEVVHARMLGDGRRAVLRESGGQIRSGFWVYLPPFPDRDAAEEVEDELRARNVQDLFIVTGSEQQNAISLGLFSTPERADQRAAEIGRLGLAPRIAERFRDSTVYWVDFVEQPDAPLEPESLGVVGSGETLPEKRTISCADIAEAAGGA